MGYFSEQSISLSTLEFHDSHFVGMTELKDELERLNREFACVESAKYNGKDENDPENFFAVYGFDYDEIPGMEKTLGNKITGIKDKILEMLKTQSIIINNAKSGETEEGQQVLPLYFGLCASA